jgi:hypothetical protein
MEGTPTRFGRRAIWLVWGVIAGIVVFNIGWVWVGTLQRGGYSVATDDVSDLAALTARYPWVLMTATGICGASTILFALFALRPPSASRAGGMRSAHGSWLPPLWGSTTSPMPSSAWTAKRPTGAAPPLQP